MGVKVERITLSPTVGEPTKIEFYEQATGFYYEPVDKILYVQISDEEEELNIAAYPRGMYIRAWLDPVPELPEKEEEVNHA